VAGQRTEPRAIGRRLGSGSKGTRTRDRRRDTASLACFPTNRKEVSALLALTDNAVQAVRDIVSASEQVPETGGLRLVAERAGTQANFQLSVVSLPAEDDEVIEEQGARVFLEPEAASLLDDMVLDASVEHNRVAFTIADSVEE
jgi:iron-sulfur cluster assembly protein